MCSKRGQEFARYQLEKMPFTGHQLACFRIKEAATATDLVPKANISGADTSVIKEIVCHFGKYSYAPTCQDFR